MTLTNVAIRANNLQHSDTSKSNTAYPLPPPMPAAIVNPVGPYSAKKRFPPPPFGSTEER